MRNGSFSALRTIACCGALILVQSGCGGDKGDAVQSNATGGQVGQIGKPISKGAAPPTIRRIEFDPPSPSSADDVVVSVLLGPKDTNVELAYAWHVDGLRNRFLDGDTLTAGSVPKGSRVEVEVTARGPDGSETTRRSPGFLVANSPPEITSTPSSSLDGFIFEADDADDDPITFSWRGAPPGYILQPDGTVVIRPGAPAGSYSISVTASDTSGGRSQYDFDIDVDETEAAPPPQKRVEYRNVADMTDQELEAYQERLAKKIDAMTEDELEEHMRKIENEEE